MSKEVVCHKNTASSIVTHNHHSPVTPIVVKTSTMHEPYLDYMNDPVEQVHSFWAPLMQYVDTTQSSLLLHFPTLPISGGTPHDRDGLRPTNNTIENRERRQAITVWQSLETTNRHLMNHPPIVELAVKMNTC